jgi:VWFA-related protein
MRPTSTRRGAAAPALLLVLLLSMLAAGPTPAQRFGETTEVVAIEVPVQVVRDGEPVRGLTTADFEVYDGRKKQIVTGFEVVDLAAVSADAGAVAAVSVAARRHFLLLFDLTFSEPKAIVKARESARTVVDSALHASDLVAVATYSAAQGPQLVLGFTSDRRQVGEAISTLGLPKLLDRAPDPLRLLVREQREAAAAGGTTARGGVNVEAEILDILEGMERSVGRNELAARVQAFSRSMSDLAKLMGSVEGRKYVVYLSEGYDDSAVVGTSDQEEIDNLNRTAETDPTKIDSDARFGSSRTANVQERMFEEFRRADCVVQTVDIGGLRTDADATNQRRGSGKSGLAAFAKDTGGDFYENFNDPKAAMGQMLQRTSVTYVLTVQPENLKQDGEFHRLRVEVKNQPRGTRVVHRPGYYAPKPFAEQSPLERLLDTANAVMGGTESGTVSMAVLAAPFRTAEARAYVPVLIEVDGPSLLAGFPGESLPLEIYTYAIEAGGTVEDFFTQNMGLDLAKAGPALRERGLKFYGHLDLAPGRYSLRVLVRNARTGKHALRAVDLEVPAFAQAGPVLLPPFFPEPQGRWLMTREAPREGDRQVDFPFLLSDQPFIPASRPVLSPGQDAQLSLVAFNLGTGEVQAAARVLDGEGKDLGPAALTLVDRERGGAASPDRLTATVRPPQLPPGAYLLQVTLTDATSGQSRTSGIHFAVRGKAAG